MQTTIQRPLFGLFAALMWAICSGGLTGCGGGPSGSSIPSDTNISDAVKQRYEERSSDSWDSQFRHILPARPAFDGLFDYGDKVTISDVRVVKRGEPFHEGSGENSMDGFPVRVSVKGMRIAVFCKMIGGMGQVVQDKSVNLPFEGEIDLVIQFESPDKRKVDPGPGKWIASPAPQN